MTFEEYWEANKEAIPFMELYSALKAAYQVGWSEGYATCGRMIAFEKEEDA